MTTKPDNHNSNTGNQGNTEGMASRGESIGSGTMFQYIGSLFALSSGLIFYVFIVHVLPVNTVGSVAMFTAVVGVFSNIFTLGLGKGLRHYLSYYIGKDDKSGVSFILGKFSLISLSLGVGASVTLFFLAGVLSRIFLHSMAYVFAIQLLSLNLAGLVLISLFNGMLIGMQKFKKSGYLFIMANTLPYILAAGMVYFYRDVTMVVVGWSIGNLVSALAYFIFIAREKPGRGFKRNSGDGYDTLSVFAYSLPLFASGFVSIAATYVDRFVVALFLNLSLIAVYNFALLLANGMRYIVTPMSSVIMPKFSEFYAKDESDRIRKGVKSAINLITMIYTPLALMLAALSGPLLFVLGGQKYTAASDPVTIILVIYSVFISQHVLNAALAGIRKTKIFLASTSLALTANFVLSVVLIPKYGLFGAALGFSSIPVVGFIFMCYFSSKHGVISYDISTLLRIWASAIAMFVALRYVQRIMPYSLSSLLIEAGIGLAVYIPLIKATRALRKEEAMFITSMLPRSMNFISKFYVLLSS